MKVDAKKYEHCPENAEDPRITKIGKWLRKLSIDEIPQLINVLKGEMSLVGPRPEMPFIVDTYENYEKKRLSVIPGITGLWQVSGRNDLDYNERVTLDATYVRQWRHALDVRILLKTVLVVLTHRGAY